jgi:hypothetical protein
MACKICGKDVETPFFAWNGKKYSEPFCQACRDENDEAFEKRGWTVYIKDSVAKKIVAEMNQWQEDYYEYEQYEEEF